MHDHNNKAKYIQIYKKQNKTKQNNYPKEKLNDEEKSL